MLLVVLMELIMEMCDVGGKTNGSGGVILNVM